MADEAKKETIAPASAPAAGAEAPKTEIRNTIVVDSNAGKTATTAAAGSGGSSGGFGEFLPMLIAMLMIFYFLLIRPEKKRRDAQLALIKQMKEGDEVVLAGIGIYGTIAKLSEKDDEVILIIDKKKDVRIKVRKEAIGTIVTEEKK